MNDTAGFTVLEVVAAIIILGVGLLGALAGLVAGQRLQNQGVALRRMTLTMQQRVEQVRAGLKSGCTAGAGNTIGIAGNTEQWTVTPVGNAVALRVTVAVPQGTVTWRDSLLAVMGCP